MIVDEPLLPLEVHLTAYFAYFRWHGQGEGPWFDYRYSKDKLEPWVPKVEETAKKSQESLWLFQQSFSWQRS